VNTVVRSVAGRMPDLVNRVVRDGVNAYLARGGTNSVTKFSTAADEVTTEWTKHARLSSLLFGAVSVGEESEVEESVREELVGELVILAHHPMVCELHCFFSFSGWG